MKKNIIALSIVLSSSAHLKNPTDKEIETHCQP